MKKSGKTVDLSAGKSTTRQEEVNTNPKGQNPEKKSKKSSAEPKGFAKLVKTVRENRAWQIVLIIVGILLIAAGTYLVLFFLFPEKEEPPEEPQEEVVIEEEEENPMARRTDGVIMSDLDEVNKYPVAVMIENLSIVRPQAGLSAANIVYETLAEGGITRFMAIFAGDPAQEIHPVRSARPYYIKWVEEYKALYAHAGGSPEALQSISGLGVNSLNGLGNDGKYFWRGEGAAPHNLYTSITLLERAVRDKGLSEEESTFESWKFSDESPNSDVPEEQEIRIEFSTGSYNVKYTYDKENNCYLRFHVDSPHNDRIAGMQLCPSNVIVQVVPPAEPAGEKGRIRLDVTGEGEVAIYRNGEEVKGTWKKEDREDRTRFYDENDEEIELTRGQVWIEVLPSDRTYEFEENALE